MLSVELPPAGKRPTLREAAQDRDIAQMRYLIRQGGDPDARDNQGRTPLYFAAKQGNIEMVALLLSHGVDPDSGDCFGETPIQKAAQKGHKKTLEYLLDHGANAVAAHKSLLIAAADNGWMELFKRCLAIEGVDPVDRGNHERLALYYAARSGQASILDELILRKVDPNFLFDLYTPLSIAIINGHDAVVGQFLKLEGIDINMGDYHRYTPLTLAVQCKCYPVVKLLLAKPGIDPDPKDKEGMTPYLWASRIYATEIMRDLMRSKGFDTQYNLFKAISQNDALAIFFLLTEGKVDPNVEDSVGITLLASAVKRGARDAIVTILWAEGLSYRSLEQAFLHAAEHPPVGFGAHPSEAMLASKCGVRYRARLFSAAAKRGNLAAVQSIIAYMSSVGHREHIDCQTPLFEAVAQGHESLLADLMLAKHTEDRNDENPLPLCYKQGICEFVQSRFPDYDWFSLIKNLMNAKKYDEAYYFINKAMIFSPIANKKPEEFNNIISLAIKENARGILDILVRDYPRQLAAGSVSWVVALVEMELSRERIVDCLVKTGKLQLLKEYNDPTGRLQLLEEYNDPDPEPLARDSEIDKKFHRLDCPHQYRFTPKEIEPSTNDCDLEYFSDPSAYLERLDWIKSTVSRLCGVDGIYQNIANRKPFRQYSEWIDDGSTARAIDIHGVVLELKGSNIYVHCLNPRSSRSLGAYRGNEPDRRILISWFSATLQRLSRALHFLQSVEYCCARFTMLFQRQKGVTDLRYLSFSNIDDMKRGVTDLLHSKDHPKDWTRFHDLCKVSWDELYGADSPLDDLADWARSALVIQTISLGVAFYAQAHVGELHPLCVSCPAQALVIMGDQSVSSKCNIIVKPKTLACASDMIGSKAWVFEVRGKLEEPNPNADFPEDPAEKVFFLRGRLCDILDTWGTAALQIGTEDGITSVEINDGFLCGVDRNEALGQIDPSAFDGQHPGTDVIPILHWTDIRDTSGKYNADLRSIRTEHGPLGPSDLIYLGAIHVNPNCPLDEKRSHSNSTLECLGTNESSWATEGTQLGVNFGVNGPVQYTISRKIRPQRLLKEQILRQWERTKNLLLLTTPWGLQVSLCTGICRRVRLKDLFSDMVWSYLERATKLSDSWDKVKHFVKEDFACPDLDEFKSRVNTLSRENRVCVVELVEQALNLLRETGKIEANQLRIWWPCDGETMPRAATLQDRSTDWLGMLEESTTCAVFAVATDLCLEIAGLRTCSEQQVKPWNPTSSCFETTLCPVEFNSKKIGLGTPGHNTYRVGSFGFLKVMRDRTAIGNHLFLTWHKTALIPVRVRRLIGGDCPELRELQDDEIDGKMALVLNKN